MARQWFLPSPGGGMIDEDGAEEYFVPTVGYLNEDQAAVGGANPHGPLGHPLWGPLAGPVAG